MAGSLEEMSSLTKAVIFVGSGVALSGVAFLLYRYMQREESESEEEGSGGSNRSASGSADHKVLVLGLDGAGKSSILAALGKQDSQNRVKPTEGFNVMCVQTEDVSLNIWEIGGGSNMRKYWTNFVQDSSVLMYVIDAADKDRLEEAASELQVLLGDDRVTKIPVLLVANKQDLPDALSSDDLQRYLLAKVSRLAISSQRTLQTSTQVPSGGHTSGIQDLENLLVRLT